MRIAQNASPRAFLLDCGEGHSAGGSRTAFKVGLLICTSLTRRENRLPMTTSTLEVGDLFSVLGAHGIERQLQRVVDIGRVSVNPVSGSTTVEYDSGRSNLSAIKAAIEECGFHCAGEALPRHVCEEHAMPSSSGQVAPIKSAHYQAHVDHAGMASPGILLMMRSGCGAQVIAKVSNTVAAATKVQGVMKGKT
jgi:copper chaperone CopZ